MSDESLEQYDASSGADKEFADTETETETIETDFNPLPYLVVGIGASAGGVEAYIDLLRSLPPDTGMTFILVPHLAPNHKSHMVDILQKHTAMQVCAIENGMRPQPNRVYIVPPNVHVSIAQGTLLLESRSDKPKGVYAIDYFFRSLATDQKNHAVGVILSGMDSDGAIGLQNIKGEGGISIVQDPASARHPDMPLNSIAADHVDKVVPPAEIAQELARLGQLFLKPGLQPLGAGQASSSDHEFLRRIFQILRSATGLDFSLYKAGTVHRRIARRMLVNQTETLRDYVQFIQAHPEEVRSLQEDLLVGLTRFFRDPDMFASLRNTVFPRLFADRPLDQPVRFWVAGCSTGEEVYSLVITLLEYTTANHLDPSIQVFGTDASERSIEKARSGIYTESLVAEISPERLRRFFVRVDKGYQVSKRIRDLCIFARQNLCTDPPFSRLDLVTCRNVLIYLGPQLQRQVIPTFHYALKASGFLVLGMSEAIRDFSDLFDAVDRKYKIFAKLPSANVSYDLSRTFIKADTSLIRQIESTETPVSWGEIELQRAADRIVIAQYGPPGFVIDDKFEILQSRGNVSPFLQLAAGATSLHLLRMLHSSVTTTVRDAVQRSIDQEIPVTVENVCIVSEGDVRQFNVEVLPVQMLPGRNARFLVLFPAKSAFGLQRLGQRFADEFPLLTGDAETAVGQLRQDLAATKIYLQSLIEERDLRNQELTSSSEEIQAANEELQSTNEELETTKEELQSANEELQTVNEELSHRNATLTDTGNDLTNLLNSVNIPVLMLDNHLQIRQFTPLTQKLLSVRPSDINRPIGEIRLNFTVDRLEDTLREVIDTLNTREIEVQDRDGRFHILKIRPYRTSDNKIEGVVMVMLDVDQLRRSQIDLSTARDFARAVIEAVPVSVLVLAGNLTVRFANNAFRELSNLSHAELEGRLFPDIANRVWGLETITQELEQLGQPGSKSSSFEKEFVTSKENKRTLHIRVRALPSEDGNVLLLTIEDITERKRAEEILARENQMLAGQVRSTSKALGQSREELRALTARLFASQEEERQHVARELHDDIGQQLALVQMEIEQVQARLAVDPLSLDRQLSALTQRMAQLSNEVRTLSHRLHPSILDDLGLAYALRSLVTEFGEREDMPATFTRLNVPEFIPKSVAAALYRVTQEALRNVSKHAGKTHVRVMLEGTPDYICLEIVDMGEGFDQEERVGGLGLLSMAERVHLIGGSFEVKSLLGRGTSINVKVPNSEANL